MTEQPHPTAAPKQMQPHLHKAFQQLRKAVGEDVVFRYDVGPVEATTTQFDGRNAFSLPSARVREIVGAMEEAQPDRRGDGAGHAAHRDH